jgi:hypothetical protein
MVTKTNLTQVENPGADGRIIKWIFRKWDGEEGGRRDGLD